MAVGKPLALIGLVVVLSACGGEDLPPPGISPAAIAADDQAADALRDSQSTELQREVFSYRGSGRDPFQSLLRRGGEVRPFLDDLRLTAVTYDTRFPNRSVAILRDKTVCGSQRFARAKSYLRSKISVCPGRQ